MIPYHNLSSLVAVLLSIFHTYVAYDHGDSSGDGDSSRDRRLSEDSAYSQFGPNPDLIKFLLDGWTNMSGTVAILCMIGLVSTSFFSFFRRWFFEFWLMTHVLCAVGVIIFCVIHSVSSILLVAFWWAVDLLFRYIIMAMCIYPKTASLELIFPDVVEVKFPKSALFSYNAGQYVQVSFPSIAPLQFHPITISSAPHETEVTLHIRAVGKWSKQLAKLAEKHTHTTIMLEGPYGTLGVDLDNDDRYQMAVMVSGGIGVTPCISLTNSLLHQHEQGRRLQKLHFAWAVPGLDMALSLLPPVMAPESVDSNVLSTNVYVTRNIQEDEEQRRAPSNASFQVHTGRPNLDVTFKELKLEASQKSLTHIAVIACGPRTMLDQVRAACRKHSDSYANFTGVKFDLHEETFDF